MHDDGCAISSDEIRFEILTKEHIPQLIAIEHEAYPDPWTQGMFHQELKNGPSHFYLAFRGDDLLAYGGFWLLLDEIHITKLTVVRPFRRRGLGSLVMDFLEEFGQSIGAKTSRLEVRESNEAARVLYASAGYTEIGIRKRYYAASGEDAVVMAKELVVPG